MAMTGSICAIMGISIMASTGVSARRTSLGGEFAALDFNFLRIENESVSPLGTSELELRRFQADAETFGRTFLYRKKGSVVAEQILNMKRLVTGRRTELHDLARLREQPIELERQAAKVPRCSMSRARPFFSCFFCIKLSSGSNCIQLLWLYVLYIVSHVFYT